MRGVFRSKKRGGRYVGFNNQDGLTHVVNRHGASLCGCRWVTPVMMKQIGRAKNVVITCLECLVLAA